MNSSCPQPPVPSALAGDHIKLAFHFAHIYSGRARNLGVCREDLVQEAVVALLRAGEHFNAAQGTAFSSYAGVVIRNHLHNVLAKRRDLPALGGEAGSGNTLPEPEDRRAAAPDAAAILADDKEYVTRLVRQLPPRERLAVTLRFGLGDGMKRTLEEVATVLQVSAERARQLVQAALMRMRRVADAAGLPRQAAG